MDEIDFVTTIVGSLYDQSQSILATYDDLQDKDIRKNYFRILSTQLAVAYNTCSIHKIVMERQEQEYDRLFDSDEKAAEDYRYLALQNIKENIMDTVFYQTELILREYYSKLEGNTPGKAGKIPDIIARLFVDNKSNWTKHETNLITLLWAIRNTNHTGGIYLNKTEGHQLSYKGEEYIFNYGKPPTFPEGVDIIDLIPDLLDSIKSLFDLPHIKAIGSIDHPNFYATGN